MQLAFLHASTRGPVDATLKAVVAAMVDQGLRPVGVVQGASGGCDRHRCEMDLIEIASGARLSISQNLGAGSTGCRLDPAAVEAVAGRVQHALGRAPADLLIVNRFGKLEATGRGFCPVIAAALEQGVPVLVGVNDLNRPALEAFADGLATELPDDTATILGWVRLLLQKAAA